MPSGDFSTEVSATFFQILEVYIILVSYLCFLVKRTYVDMCGIDPTIHVCELVTFIFLGYIVVTTIYEWNISIIVSVLNASYFFLRQLRKLLYFNL